MKRAKENMVLNEACDTFVILTAAARVDVGRISCRCLINHVGVGVICKQTNRHTDSAGFVCQLFVCAFMFHPLVICLNARSHSKHVL